MFGGHSFVRPRQSHSSVPTADFSRRRVERQSRTALLQRRRRLVLDGREHDGMLRRIGAERDRTTWRTYDNADDVHRIDRVPSSASPVLHRVREVQVGKPSIKPIASPSKYVILCTGTRSAGPRGECSPHSTTGVSQIRRPPLSRRGAIQTSRLSSGHSECKQPASNRANTEDRRPARKTVHQK